MEETKQRRVEYFRNRFFANYPSRYSYGAADFMRRLSLIDARGVELGKLEIIPRGQDISFNLNVSVTAANDSHAQGIFSRFYQALKNFEDIIEINFATASASTPSALASAVRDKAKRPYNITGVIELE
jgi:shikimate kinase